MIQYLTKKICRFLVLFLGLSLLVFVLGHFMEGNPAQLALQQAGIDPTPEEIARMEEVLGLDQNLMVQYRNWLVGVLRLDFGTSHISGRPVWEEMALRIPATASLALGAFVLMLMLALPLGVLAVRYRGGKEDKLLSALTLLAMGIPAFVLGAVLLYLFALRWGVLPMAGRVTPLRHVLPMLTLALPMAARYARVIRASLLAVLEEDYIFQLRAYGLKESGILFRDALKHASIPLVNLLGISFGALIGGSIVVETIFSWPGLGTYLLSSIEARDYPVILAYTLFMGAVFLFIHSLIDGIACLLDPRILHDKGGRA